MLATDTHTIDVKTRRAVICAAASAGLTVAVVGGTAGLSLAVVEGAKQAAALAAISSLFVGIRGEPPYDKEYYYSEDKTRQKRIFVIEGLVISSITVLAAKHLVSFQDWDLLKLWGATTLGVIGVTHFFSEDDHHFKDPERAMPSLAYPLFGLAIGALRPQWITPAQGAVLMGLLQVRYLMLYPSELEDWGYASASLISLPYRVSLLALPWAAHSLGVPAGAQQCVIAYLATRAIESAIDCTKKVGNAIAEHTFDIQLSKSAEVKVTMDQELKVKLNTNGPLVAVVQQQRKK